MLNNENVLNIIVSKKYCEEYKKIVPWYIMKIIRNGKIYIGEGYTEGAAEANLQKSFYTEFYEQYN